MAFLMLFGLLGSTFLFQNGLLGILCSRFKGIILLSILYILLTVGLGLYRLVRSITYCAIGIWSDIGWHGHGLAFAIDLGRLRILCGFCRAKDRYVHVVCFYLNMV